MMIRATLALAAAALTGLAAVPAEAETRLRFNFRPFNPGHAYYYRGPAYYPSPRYSYYYDPDPRFYDEFDPRYEDRDYEPPVRRLKRRSRTETKPALPKAKPKTQAKATAISCAKASKIVADYGFSAVKSTSCKGQVYSFKAIRDGKDFTVKLSAKNGELTEVKKL